MRNEPYRVVHSQKVVHSLQSTGKSSWKEDLSHKESEEKGEGRVTKTGLKWGSFVWPQNLLISAVSAMDGALVTTHRLRAQEHFLEWFVPPALWGQSRTLSAV